MSRPAVILLALVASIWLAPRAASAQTALRFDMGIATSPVERGFTQVLFTTTYTQAAGYGWVTPLGRGFDRFSVQPAIKTDLPAALIQDGLTATNDGVFQVDLPAGQYLCVAYLGDTGTSRALTPRDHLDVLVNGVEVVSDAYARTATMKAQMTQLAIGGVKRVRFLASPQNGNLQITFHCDGTGTSTNSVLGLEVYPYTAPPISFDHASRSLKASPAHQTALGPALTAMNAHDYPQARTLLDAVPDPLARAWGYAWLTGWLTGAEDDVDLELLARTRALLEGLNRPDDPSVAVLLQDVRDMERGALMNRLRGYPSTYHPESLDNIVLNLAAAVALFEQMDDDILGASKPALPECPFYPRARFLIARNMYSRYTGVGDPQAEWAAFWLGILQNEFAPKLALFPKAAELEVFTFFATRYATNGGLVQNWRGPTSVPTFDPATTWWAPHTELADPAAAPKWAQHLRAYLNQFRSAGTWWMNTRLHQGEIGGGGGDDVEGAGLLSLPSIARNEPGHALERGIKECLEKVLFGPEVNQQEGYFANCGDVEHAGEYTAYPLFALLPTNFGRPSHLTMAMRGIRNMDETVDPAPWTTPVGTGLRHFKSYIFGATSVCGPARDIPCNIRAIIPGFFLTDYNNSPRTVQLFEELARAWAANAMSTDLGKPKGIPPTAVSPTSPPVFGTSGQWWTNGGYYDLPNGTAYYSYLYALFLAAYHNSTAPDRHVLLEPILHSGYLAYANIKGQLSNTQPGGDKWTADTLKGPIASIVAEAYPALAADPTLALTAADLAKLSLVISTDAAPYLQYLHASGTGPKDKQMLQDTFERARVWMRYFWPLGTSSVSYTDRIYVMNAGSHQLLYSAMMGGSFSVNPSYVLSWVNPNPVAGELDVAPLVNGYTNASLDILLFNFASKKQDIALRLWRRLEFGKYSVSIGNDADQDDRIDGTPHTYFTVDYDARGMTITLPQVPDGVLQKVEFRKLSPLPGSGALLPDLAVSDDDVALRPGGKIAVTVHNLGSADATGGTLELWEEARLLGTHPLPAIPAPNDLTPRATTVEVPYRPVLPGKALTVRVKLAAAVKEVTLFNNETTVSLAVPAPTLALQNRTGITSFDVTLDSPHDPGKFYGIAPGVSGTAPGTPLGSGLKLPLNWDLLTTFALTTGAALFRNAIGTLDSSGRGTLEVRVPYDPRLHGLAVHFAGATLTAEGFRATSPALPVLLQ
ncbi:MAG: hypothetical protein JXQ29_17215 [Planctomycetes bacterium]|nr:hypothetical protein [Planctomycetota bacterium]